MLCSERIASMLQTSTIDEEKEELCNHKWNRVFGVGPLVCLRCGETRD